MEEKKFFVDDLYHNYFKVYEKKGRGKKILIISGIHGDEYTSIYVNEKLKDDLDKINSDFNITILPIANMGAFLYRSRCSPYGGEDLNRIFPGDLNGSLSERLANQIFNIAMENDLVIDLHSCGFLCRPYVLLNFKEKGDVKLKIDIVHIVKSKGRKGQLMTELIKNGVESFIIEVPSGFGGYIQIDHANNIYNALKNFLEEKETKTRHVYLDPIVKVRADEFGLFLPNEEALKVNYTRGNNIIGIFNKSMIVTEDVPMAMHFPSYVFKGEILYEYAKII